MAGYFFPTFRIDFMKNGFVYVYGNSITYPHLRKGWIKFYQGFMLCFSSANIKIDIAILCLKKSDLRVNLKQLENKDFQRN